MDFFFSPLACSLAGRVLIREHSLDIQQIPVSLQRKTTGNGQDFRDISPQGLVPVLRFDDGRVLTENIAILQVLADMAPNSGLLPRRDTPAGQATLQWLGFVATELHKLCLYPIFQAESPDAAKAWSRSLLPGRLSVAARQLAQTPWLAGENFTMVDSYFGWVLMLSQHAGIALEPVLQAAWQRLLARPAFAECLAEEQSMYKHYA